MQKRCIGAKCDNIQSFEVLGLCQICFEKRFIALENKLNNLAIDLYENNHIENSGEYVESEKQDLPEDDFIDTYDVEEDLEEIDTSKVWVDEDYGLMWELINERTWHRKYTYEEAEEYVSMLNQLNYAGYNDWRLPTYMELSTLRTQYGCPVDGIENNTYEDTEKEEYISYWSSSKHGERYKAVCFYNEDYEEDFLQADEEGFLRCVRFI